MDNADMSIAALQSGFTELAARVRDFDDDDLARPSGAAEWDISQVLSHLGSGAVIGLATIEAALQGKPNPGQEFNISVWDRWNAMSRRERADEFLVANSALLTGYQEMDAETRESLRVDMGFLPAPVDVATVAQMRLSEFALHSWDVRVGFDQHATLAPESIAPVLSRASGLLGWISKPAVLEGQSAVLKVVTTDPDEIFTLTLGDQVALAQEVPANADGELSLPAESLVRLLSGRLSPAHTPAAVSVSGPIDLPLLRQVFPGY